MHCPICMHSAHTLTATCTALFACIVSAHTLTATHCVPMILCQRAIFEHEHFFFQMYLAGQKVTCTLYPVPCTLYPVPCTLYPVFQMHLAGQKVNTSSPIALTVSLHTSLISIPCTCLDSTSYLLPPSMIVHTTNICVTYVLHIVALAGGLLPARLRLPLPRSQPTRRALHEQLVRAHMYICTYIPTCTTSVT